MSSRASEARPGTHNHECSCCAKLERQLCLRHALVVMGPRLRGDDGLTDQPLAAFLRYARCTAQLQPAGCAASSGDATSLAGAADDGASVGIACLTRRSCADWSCAGM